MKCFIIYLIAFTVTSIESSGPKLLFANRKDIRVIDIQNGKISKSILVKDVNDASSVDYFYEKQEVCWTDIGKEFIKCVSLNKTNDKSKNLKEVKLLNRGISSPDGMAIDWLTEKLYWADSETNKIEVAELHGHNRKLLFWNNLDQPRAIALVPSKGIMFWSDWGEKPKIEQAGMNGEEDTRKIIVDQNILWPNGLTVDFEEERIFWVDGKLYSLSSANFDGSNRIKVLGQLKHPFSITYFDQTLYWTDWDTESIHYCRLNSKTKCEKENELSLKLTPMYIHAYEQSRQPQSSTPCHSNNGGCSHLCLLAPGNSNYSCSCSTGVKLKDKFNCEEGPNEMLLLARRSDLRRISLDTPDHTPVVVPVADVRHAIAVDFDPVDQFFYWTDDEAFLIQRARLNGSDQEILVQSEGLDSDGIAIDWLARNLYWSDTETNRIEVAKINGSSRKILLRGGLDKPRAIALFPEAGLMFWTDWGDDPKIERANLDGSERMTIVNTDLGWPNGVAVDYSEKNIYWVDASTRVIEMSELDGNNRKIILGDKLPHVFGFSLLGDFLYWTDWQKRSIERVHKRNETFREVLVEQLPDVMGLKALSMHQEMGFSPCMNSNGNCSHLCFNRPSHLNYVCDCPLNLELDHDERTCVSPKAFLLYSQHETIRRVSLRTAKDIALPIPAVKQANTLDYDAEGRLYWSDARSKVIFRSHMNGSEPDSVVQFGLQFPLGLAIDWVANNLYWADTNANRIELSTLDGSFRKVIQWNVTSPKFMAVNPHTKFLFWSESTKDGDRVMRAWLDGSFPKMVATAQHIQGLTIDRGQERIYVLDVGIKTIFSCDFDGANRKIIVENLDQPNDLVLYDNNLYWPDWHTQTIVRTNKFNGTNIDKFKKFSDYVTDLLIFETSRESNSSNGCRNHNCSQLCIATVDGFQCACATHFTLHQDAVTCIPPRDFLVYSQRSMSTRLVTPSGGREFEPVVLPVATRNVRSLEFDPLQQSLFWIDAKTQSVRVARGFVAAQETQTKHVVKKNNIDPVDIAVDPGGRFLFWSCGKNNIINVTTLEGTEIGTIIGLLEDGVKPRSLAFLSASATLYFVNQASPPSIELLFGSDRRTVVSAELRSPTALVADDHRLFWADVNPPVIETLDLKKNQRKTLVSLHLQHPVDLAVQGDFLYWADDRLDTIERVHKDTGAQRAKIVTSATHLSAIVAMTQEMFESAQKHPCGRSPCTHLCIKNVPSDSPMQSYLQPPLFHCECPQGTVLGSDLLSCVVRPLCKPKHFSCLSDHMCIPIEWRCDGLKECSDGSDEINCPSAASCGPGFFRCESGQCIASHLECDKIAHCADSSDELECCAPGHSLCKSTAGCTPCGSPHQCPDRLLHCSAPLPLPDSRPELRAVGGSIAAFVGAALIALVVLYCRRSPTMLDEGDSNPPLKAASPRPPPPKGTLEENMRMSLLVDLYTGVSSSSSSMMNHYPRETANPPPTPVAPCCYPPAPLHSSYRHYKSHNRPPPPTPASTDVFDDSDLCSTVSAPPPTPLHYDSDPHPHPPPPSPTTSFPPSPSTDRSYCVGGPCPSPMSPSLSE